jgi:LPS O-antigen subunit length determinant protein (WzzB/FepE family)|tara:strand:- start:325 stop:1128 length:804 start_codon:yes stop_codon:yes gene_type:complete
MSQIQDEHIDLLDLMKQLWDGKWLISIFVFIFAVVASTFLFFQDSVYESKLSFTMKNIPPFYKMEKFSTVSGEITMSSIKPVRDLEKLFHNKKIFESWKQSYRASEIVYKNLSLTKLIDDLVISKDKRGSIIIWTPEIDNYHFLVKSNELLFLNDLFNYLTHVNRLLQSNYYSQAKIKLTRLERDINSQSYMTKMQDNPVNLLQDIKALKNYLSNSNKIAGPFNIERPTLPEKISPKSYLIMILSIITGILVGIFFVVMRNAASSHE